MIYPSMDAVILCGGLGKRMQLISKDTPKVLFEIEGKPFMDYVLRFLKNQGLHRVILCVGHLSGKVRDYCGEGAAWGLEVVYSEEKELLGTAGAVINAADRIQSENFWVLNGDSLLEMNLSAMHDFHQAKSAKITLGLTKVSDQKRFGAVFMNENQEITRFNEKKAEGAGWINGGLYLIQKTVLEGRALKPCSWEEGIFPSYLGQGLYGFASSGSFFDIGVPESYASVQKIMAKQKGDTV